MFLYLWLKVWLVYEFSFCINWYGGIIERDFILNIRWLRWGFIFLWKCCLSYLCIFEELWGMIRFDLIYWIFWMSVLFYLLMIGWWNLFCKSIESFRLIGLVRRVLCGIFLLYIVKLMESFIFWGLLI